MNFRDATRARQDELDRFALRRGWERLRFRSWRVKGWTVSVGTTGYPQRHFVAAKGDEVRKFTELDELARFVLGARSAGQRSADPT